jgi:DNA topoisomerase-1
MLLEIREEVQAELREDLPDLKPEEVAVLSLLEARLKRETEKRQPEKPAPRRRRRVGAEAEARA